MSAKLVGSDWGSGLKFRPHPGPLPQERENRSAASVCAKTVRLGKLFFSAHHGNAAAASGDIKLSNCDASLTLSPGERAGVRAELVTVLSGKEFAHA